MKKFLIAVAAIIMAFSVGATTIEEFFATVKKLKGADYSTLPTFLIPNNNGNIKKVEMIEFESLNDSTLNLIEEARDAISITEDMTITREIEENDDCRTYMKVEGDNFYFLIIEIEKSGEETSCEMAKMICDKKALDNPNFIKFVKKD